MSLSYDVPVFMYALQTSFPKAVPFKKESSYFP